MFYRVMCLLLVVLASSATIATPQSASATVVRALSLEDLTERADAIAVVVVETSQSQHTPDGFRIVTIHQAKVRDAVAGCSAGDILRIQTLGGRVDHLAQVVPGAAHFGPGELALVFLAKVDDPTVGTETYVVVGLSQGKMAVEVDPQSSVEVVTQDLGNLTLTEVAPTADGKLAPTKAPAKAAVPAPMPLGQVIEQVRARVATP